MCRCTCCEQETRPRGLRPLALLFNIALAWVLLVVAGGTLVNSGHPVAVEAGRLLQTITFVEPAITWADGRDMPTLAGGLRLLEAGIPLSTG